MAFKEVTESQFQDVWRAVEETKAARRRSMPSERAALVVLFEAWQRLKELGWREGQYCPKDGSAFEVCMLGSTGTFRCTYHGEWPRGHAMVEDGGDIYPQHPGGLMWRPLKPEEKK